MNSLLVLASLWLKLHSLIRWINLMNPSVKGNYPHPSIIHIHALPLKTCFSAGKIFYDTGNDVFKRNLLAGQKTMVARFPRFCSVFLGVDQKERGLKNESITVAPTIDCLSGSTHRVYNTSDCFSQASFIDWIQEFIIWKREKDTKSHALCLIYFIFQWPTHVVLFGTQDMILGPPFHIIVPRPYLLAKS